MSDKESPKSSNKNMIIIASIIIAAIAVVGIAFLLLNKAPMKETTKMVNVSLTTTPTTPTSPSPTTTTAKQEKTMKEVKPEKELFTIKFRKLLNVVFAAPLNYPTKDGVVFVAVKTVGGTQQIWTFKDGKVVGVYDLPNNTIPVMDPRLMSYATMDDKLLIVMNNTLYELYGNQTTKIAHIETNGTASFIKVGDKIYTWEIVTKKEKNNITMVYCNYYDALNGMKKIRGFEFQLQNVSTYNVLPDALDAQGCIAIYAKPKDLNVYYWYKGVNGEAKGKYNPAKLRLTTYGPMFLEYEPHKTKPYMMMIQMIAPGMMHAFKLYIVDILQKSNVSFVLPGLYNFVGMGDFQGKGYISDVALVTMNPTGFSIVFASPNGWHKEIKLGALSRSIAWLQGVVYKGKGFMNVFGLGNFTDNNVSILSNVGKFNFKVQGAPAGNSSLTIIASINGDELCYSAVINPITGGLLTKETTTGSTVYISSGCFKGTPLT